MDEEEIRQKIISIMILIGFLIFLALALLKVFLIIAVLILFLDFVFFIIYLVTQEEAIGEFLKWGLLALIAVIIVIILLYLIGVVFGNTFIGQQSKELFQLYLNLTKSLTQLG